jgi:hypothetical protein
VNGADDWFAQTGCHGLVFRKDVLLRIDECNRRLALVYRCRIKGPIDAKDTNEGTRDLEPWVGRGKDGALVLKRIERRLVPRAWNKVAAWRTDRFIRQFERQETIAPGGWPAQVKSCMMAAR